MSGTDPALQEKKKETTRKNKKRKNKEEQPTRTNKRSLSGRSPFCLRNQSEVANLPESGGKGVACPRTV